MRALILEEPGDPDQLRPGRVPVPEIGERDVLVKVRACGVCGHDVLARAGRIPADTPLVLEHEVAGEVAVAGPRVHILAEGMRVALTPMLPCCSCELCIGGSSRTCRRRGGLYGDGVQGGYAEFIVATEHSAVQLPDSIGLVEGSIIGCAVASALRAVRRGRVALGETVLVTGASGGVGIHLVQLARMAGARVIAVTASEAKVGPLREAGADEVAVQTDDSFDTAVRDLTRGRGADVVLDNVDPSNLVACLRALKTGGRLVLVGNVDPRPLPVFAGQLIMREFELIGTARPGRQELQDSIALVESGRVKPWVDSLFPLDAGGAAHRRMEERHAVGRCVLTVD